MQPEEDRAYYDPRSAPFGADKRCRMRMACKCGGAVEFVAETLEFVCRRTGKAVLRYRFQVDLKK